MPHGAHLLNGIIQINFQQVHKSSGNCSALQPDASRLPQMRLCRTTQLGSSWVYSHEVHFKKLFSFKKPFQNYATVKTVHRVPEYLPWTSPDANALPDRTTLIETRNLLLIQPCQHINRVQLSLIVPGVLFLVQDLVGMFPSHLQSGSFLSGFLLRPQHCFSEYGPTFFFLFGLFFFVQCPLTRGFLSPHY